MDKPTCLIPECDRPAYSRGLCKLHYERAWRSGELDAIAAPRRKPRLTDIDEATMTCTCPIHGAGVRLRVRTGRRGRYACWNCDRRPPRNGRKSWPTSAESSRRWRLKAKYGLTPDDFDALLEAQAGACLICDAEMDQPQIDHDHATGVVRGLLCRSCNIGLGYFRDDVVNMRRAIAYLEDAG